MKQKKVVVLYAASVVLVTLHCAGLLSSSANTQNLKTVTAPVSIGELIDKITILEIKSEKIKNPEKLANIRFEKTVLTDILDQHITHTGPLANLTAELLKTNKKLWAIEDCIREKEAKKEFDQEFIEIARSVYFTNDYRGKLKYSINQLTESCLVEEKQYAEYQ